MLLGKVVGGTSVINGMMYMRGNPEDYENWETLGNKGWNGKEALKYFIKSEDYVDDSTKEEINRRWVEV